MEVLTLWCASFRDHGKCIAKLVLIGLIVWGYSVSHHHFCIRKIKLPISGLFLIPLLKSLVLAV